MFSIKDMVKEISKAAGLPEEDIKKKVEEKQIELSGLVSPEGAAYIVGKELGVNLIKETVDRRLKIRNVIPGMRSIDVTGRVIRISKRRDFEKDGRLRGVVNVMLGDETGVLGLSLWNEEIEVLNNLGINVGEVINVRNGYVKENGRGGAEIRLGRAGKITKSGIKMPEISEISDDYGAVKAKNISDISEEGYAEVRGSLVQVFGRNPFFEVCPKCETRLEKVGNEWVCKEHGKIEPKYNLVLSGVIDDGSGNIRAVFFREVAERVFGIDMASLRKLVLDSDEISKIYENIQMGKEFIIRGRVKKNQFTEKMEIVANYLEEINPKEEMEKLLSRMGVKY
jgi:replication factor A1